MAQSSKKSLLSVRISRNRSIHSITAACWNSDSFRKSAYLRSPHTTPSNRRSLYSEHTCASNFSNFLASLPLRLLSLREHLWAFSLFVLSFLGCFFGLPITLEKRS